MNDIETLQELNRGYVRAAEHSDVALIHAGFRDQRPDGQEGRGQYTDIWARRAGQWRCVAAHFTRF